MENSPKPTSPYKHAEAFCLMRYGCECGHFEIIWNSRDGVTPSGMSCPSCGEPTLRHTDFHRDVRMPDHAPYRGQHFWRDGTPEDALAIIERRIVTFDKMGFAVPPDIQEQLRASAKNQTDEFLPGWPVLDTSDGTDRQGKRTRTSGMRYT